MGAQLRRGWFAAVPAVVSLGLGLWNLDVPAPWLDERFTTEAAASGLSTHLWDAPMLPFYGVEWLWSGGGHWTDIAWLRLLSVIAASLAVAITALTANRLTGPRAGLAAGMLLAIAPGFSRYAQEARVYAVAALLVAAATYALVRAAHGSTRRWWVGYGVLVGLAIVFLPVTAAVVPAHGIILIGSVDRRPAVSDWLASCLFLVPILAIDVVLAGWFAGTRTWLAAPSLADLGQAPWLIANSEYTGQAGAIVAVALVVLGLITGEGARWVSGLAVSVVSVWLVSVTLGSWWLPRSFIPLAPLLCVAAGLAFTSLAWPRIVALLTVLGLVALPAHREIRAKGSRGIDVREIADVLRAESRPTDVVLAPAPGSPPWEEAQFFPAAWAARQYLPVDQQPRPDSSPPEGRYWETSTQPSCLDFREWRQVGDAVLRLCL